MVRKSLYFASALAGALVWSVAAQAAPGQTTGSVNMRTGPGTAYPVIAQIPAGAPVDIGNCGGWCELNYAGRSGYVSANFVATRNAPAPSYADPNYAYYDYAPAYFDDYYNDDGFFGDGFGFHGGHHFHGGFGGGHGFGGGGGHGFGGGGGGHGGGHGVRH